MPRWYDARQKTLGLLYLFLSAETRINDNDYSLFEASGKPIEGFSGMKGEIIGECEKLLATPDGSKTRFEIVSDIFSKETSDDPNVNRVILWLLMSFYHLKKGKKQLVDLWAKESKIAENILFEMWDTCETKKAIDEYQNWLETNKGMMTHQEFSQLMAEQDKDLKSLQQGVNELIALG